MDQVKVYLRVLRKHHFWVLCGLVVLLGLGFWWMSTGELSAAYAKNKAQIDSKQKEVQSVTSITPHPNQQFITTMDQSLETLRDGVTKAWEQQYQQQKNQIYVWPKHLGADFHEHVELPAAKTRIRNVYLERYQNTITQEFERLAKIVQAEWAPGGSSGVGGGPGMGSPRAGGGLVRRGRGRPPGMVGGAGEDEEDADKYLVDWNPGNQRQIFDWYDWLQTPTTQQVWLAQEDLWVYEALCGVIARANQGATGRHNAPVKEIEAISVAYDALDAQSTVQDRILRFGTTDTESSGGGGGMMGGPGMLGGPLGGGMGESSEGGNFKPPRPIGNSLNGGGSQGPGMAGIGPGAGGGSESGEALSPEDMLLSWRYVDPTGKPLMAADLETAEHVGYKLVPFRVSLVMDQRSYDRLLVEFRNSTLPLEVREFRINPEASSGGRGTGGGLGGGMAVRPAGGGAGPALGGTAGGQNDALMSQSRPVEITGVAYLFDPPDSEKLGVEEDENSDGDAGGATSIIEDVEEADVTDASQPTDVEAGTADGEVIDGETAEGEALEGEPLDGEPLADPLDATQEGVGAFDEAGMDEAGGEDVSAEEDFDPAAGNP